MEEVKVNNMSKECDIPSASCLGKCTSQNCTVLSRNAMMFLYSRKYITPLAGREHKESIYFKGFLLLADKRLHPHPHPQISQFH